MCVGYDDPQTLFVHPTERSSCVDGEGESSLVLLKTSEFATIRAKAGQLAAGSLFFLSFSFASAWPARAQGLAQATFHGVTLSASMRVQPAPLAVHCLASIQSKSTQAFLGAWSSLLSLSRLKGRSSIE